VNHLGDTNKMVDTPRTDAHSWHDGDYDDPLHAFADFAKQLERELNASTLEVERLTNKVAQLYEGAEEQKQRIRRLEEAGDAMAEWLENPRNLGADACLSHAWREAKEAKP